MNFNSPVFLCIPSLNIVIAVPFQEIPDHYKEAEICLNCKYFHKLEDWREVPEGFHPPKGECRRHVSIAKGFPLIHGGKHCGEFEPTKED